MRLRIPAYKEHGERDVRIRSAITAIKALIALDLYPAHKKELIDICIWKITEADGKWKTRYRSVGALQPSSEVKLQHEHVVEKQKLIAALLNSTESVETIVAKAIGCVVTKDEHASLTTISRLEPLLDGWERYKRAGVTVIDLKTGREIEYLTRYGLAIKTKNTRIHRLYRQRFRAADHAVW